MYFLAIPRVIYSMLSGWSEPAIGILVSPGRSIRVKSGQLCEYILKIMGLSIIFFEVPAALFVR